MFPKETEMVDGLRRVVFPVGSYDKKFSQSMAARLERKDPPPMPLSVRQWHFLVSVYHKYRGQIRDHDRHCPACKAMSEGVPLVMQVCPECGYKVGMVLRSSADGQHYCARCSRVPYSKFKLERVT